MHRYRDLKVWQKAIGLTLTIYRESKSWPAEERYGLTSQIRRAACSIPLNIAEGAGNDSEREFARFLQIALRSTYEVMTALEIAKGLTYLAEQRSAALQAESDEIAAMIVGLIKTLNRRSATSSSKLRPGT